MADQAFTIREINPEEWADELDRVFKSAYRQEARWIGVTTFPPLERTRADLAASENRFFACFAGDELCGAVELEYGIVDGERQTTIASLAVAPAHFRSGIGRALVTFVLARATGPVGVSTGTANHPAVRLYERLGFERVRRFTTPEGVEMVAYAKRVADAR